MGLFNVPQYINVEDKVAGPLTIKQLLWMIGMGATLFTMWSLLSKAVFFLLGIPTALLFVAFAFYRPYGQPLISFVFSGIRFMFGPKVYVWKRTTQKMQVNYQQRQNEAKQEKAMESQDDRRRKALENLKGIAKIIDSKGTEADEDVVSILKKPEVRK
ncbi:MAG: hypothetical protein UY41_C0029G0004 [Candidatus Moranbacteria bacterium GW2011_GWE1_49_15]|nr:MAG: hypothetical protein UX75_C0033G0003 [Candidatus Moranbacteria bacterium GW2011_GWE2_47_10]KKW06329.1 MAG: hypothetical protein UY41_C0029G0004 [Candidatus Moranbacteria bacterium GW2011_GWE1_49_15]HBP01547.1 hypothetical protein [Candidatus Moranbacteria bacterium]